MALLFRQTPPFLAFHLHPPRLFYVRRCVSASHIKHVFSCRHNRRAERAAVGSHTDWKEDRKSKTRHTHMCAHTCTDTHTDMHTPLHAQTHTHKHTWNRPRKTPYVPAVSLQPSVKVCWSNKEQLASSRRTKLALSKSTL